MKFEKYPHICRECGARYDSTPGHNDEFCSRRCWKVYTDRKRKFAFACRGGERKCSVGEEMIVIRDQTTKVGHELYLASQKWTKAMHAFALKRYAQRYGLFPIRVWSGKY